MIKFRVVQIGMLRHSIVRLFSILFYYGWMLELNCKMASTDTTSASVDGPERFALAPTVAKTLENFPVRIEKATFPTTPAVGSDGFVERKVVTTKVCFLPQTWSVIFGKYCVHGGFGGI
jgi:hypothetical protein